MAGLPGTTPAQSSSPFLTPETKASHSARVNRSTGPVGSLELRTALPPPGNLATSTQLPREKLSELLIHVRSACPSDLLE